MAHFLDEALTRELRAVLAARDRRGEFRQAAVGAGAHRAVRPSVRGDRIHWLSAPYEPAERRVLDGLEALRLGLNEQAGLGLFDLECHYAIYPPGARYARHRDRSPAGAERVVSIVLYLGEAWSAGDGGELVLYGEPPVTVAPVPGTLVAFASADLEHEVLPTRIERRSLTGWYRRRAMMPAP